MTSVTVNVMKPHESNIYSRSADHRLVTSNDMPSSPQLNLEAIQIASGRRKSFEPKNDLESQRKSERRVPSHSPRLENGDLVTHVTKLAAVKVEDSPVRSTAPPIPMTLGVESSALNQSVKNALADEKVVSLNVSPPLPRKDAPPSPKGKYLVGSELRTKVDSLDPQVYSGRREVESIVPKSNPPLSERRRREKKPVVETVEEKKEQEGSPPANRRLPVNSGEAVSGTEKSSDQKRKPRRKKPAEKSDPEKSGSTKPKKRSENIHKEEYSRIAKPANSGSEEGPESDRLSSRRVPSKPTKVKSGDRIQSRIEESQRSKPNYTDSTPQLRPIKSKDSVPQDDDPDHRSLKKKREPRTKEKRKSPEKAKSSRSLPADAPTVRVGGKQLTSRDMENLNQSSDSTSTSRKDASQSESSRSSISQSGTSTEVTSRRKIKARTAALDKKLEETYPAGEFCPEDDEHLRSAIKIALEESKKQSVKEALDAGYDLNATILETLSRPEAIPEVIEKLVSQRRERIHDSKKEPKKSPRKVVVEKPVRKTKEVPVVKKPESLPKKKVRKTKKNRSEDEANDVLAQAFRKSGEVEQIGGVQIKEPLEESESSPSEDDQDAVEEDEIKIKSVPVRLPKNGKISTPRLQPTIEIDQGYPKAALSGTPINLQIPKPEEPLVQIVDEPDDDVEEVEELKKPVKRRTQYPEEDEPNVKLPKSKRKVKPKDQIERPDALGQQDSLYDPLGVDGDFEDDEDEVGDDIYDESSEDEEKLTIDEKKDEMLYRFKLVKEAYPGIALPRITKKMKLAKMVRLFEHTMSRVKLKVKVRNFKVFLIGGLLLMQFLAKKAGDSSGFVVNQMYAMKRYEPYLREFGESDWSSVGVDLPVMVRLPLFMVVNLVIFMVAKWIFKKTGKDYSDQFHKLYAQLTGGDDYSYIKDESGNAGLDAGGTEEGGGDGGGIFGILKSVMGMFGGGGGGGGEEARPKRGEAKGPTYKKRAKPE